jgi:hypothetical protein
MFEIAKKYKPLFFTVVLLTGCATQIKTLRDPAVDFNQYRTFCWLNGCEFSVIGPTYLNDSLIHENFKKAIVAELRSKGLKEDSDAPDLLVGFTITIKDEQAILYHREGDTPFYVPMERTEEVVNYLKGTLVIGFADKKTSKMVWESQASRFMELNPDLSEKNIAKGIHLVLKKFPTGKQ